MVALALSSIILMMVAKVFSGASRVFSVTDQTTEVYTNVRIVFDIMQEQLESICPEWSPEGLPDRNSFKGIVGTDSSDKDKIQIRFSDSNTSSNSIQVVTYNIDVDGNLAWGFGSDWTNPTLRKIIENVSALKIEYWDYELTSWVDGWSPATRSYLPTSIKLEITIEDVLTSANNEPQDLTFTRILQIPIAPQLRQ